MLPRVIGHISLEQGIERTGCLDPLPQLAQEPHNAGSFSAWTAGWVWCAGKPFVHKLCHLPTLACQLPGKSFFLATSVMK